MVELVLVRRDNYHGEVSLHELARRDQQLVLESNKLSVWSVNLVLFSVIVVIRADKKSLVISLLKHFDNSKILR